MKRKNNDNNQTLNNDKINGYLGSINKTLEENPDLTSKVKDIENEISIRPPKVINNDKNISDIIYEKFNISCICINTNKNKPKIIISVIDTAFMLEYISSITKFRKSDEKFQQTMFEIELALFNFIANVNDRFKNIDFDKNDQSEEKLDKYSNDIIECIKSNTYFNKEYLVNILSDSYEAIITRNSTKLFEDRLLLSDNESSFYFGMYYNAITNTMTDLYHEN